MTMIPIISMRLHVVLFILFVVGCLVLREGTRFGGGGSASSPFADAKEIVATKEWTRIGENDTIAAGMHVRMDLSTGEKWVKLIDDDDDDDANDKGRDEDKKGASNDDRRNQAQVSGDGLVIVQNADDGTDRDEPGGNEGTAASDDREAQYDYEMMHQALLKLPPEEQERMGGIPKLPDAGGGGGISKLTPREREFFERRMREIWEQRQEELRELQQEHVADLPEILKDRIKRIEDYLSDPRRHLVSMILDGGGGDDDEDGDDLTDIVAVLKDLEYHLTDVDMTRDFHTLGGWPLLCSLLSDAVHRRQPLSSNATTTEASGSDGIGDDVATIGDKIRTVQSNAAWALGTAVKNTGEFIPYATEEMWIDGANTTPLDMLLASFEASSPAIASTVAADEDEGGPVTSSTLMQREQKTLYAISSLLRGNRQSQVHFTSAGGPTVLAKRLRLWADAVQEEDEPGVGQADGADGSSSSSSTKEKKRIHQHATKMIKRLLTLTDDIISDVSLHPSQSGRSDEEIVDSFSNEDWCVATIQVARQQERRGQHGTQEVVVPAIQRLSPHCFIWDESDIGSLRVALQSIKEGWKNDGLEADDEILQARIELVDSALASLARD